MSADTRSRVAAFYAALAGGDGAGVVAAMAPDVVLDLPAGPHNAVIPYIGVFRGPEGIAECGRLRDLSTETLDYRVLDILADGARAAVTTFTRARCRATGAVYEIEDIHHLTLDAAGRIGRWKIYFDSAIEVAAFRHDAGPRLVAAVRAGDAAAVADLLAAGAPATARDAASGLTALMLAAGLGRADLVSALLAAGADPFAKDSRAGASALHKACQAGALDCVRLLVAAGVPVDEPATSTGHTPLVEAVWFKRPDIVAWLAGQGAGLHGPTRYGFSLFDHLAYALKVNQVDRPALQACDAAVRAREAADAAAEAAQTLMRATAAGDIDGVRAALAAGAEVDARAPVRNGFDDAHTPLLVAARSGFLEIARLLLAAGADPNAVEPTFGAVPLHKATYNGHVAMTALLAAQPGINLDFQGATNGYTPLHDALWHGFEDCARLLVEAGARLDLPGHDGLTPPALARTVFGAGHPLTALIDDRNERGA